MKAKDEIERLAKEIWQAQGAVGVRGDVKAGLRSVPYSLTESAKQRTIYKAVMQLKLGIKEAMRGQLSKSASYNGQRIYTKRQPPNILIPAKN